MGTLLRHIKGKDLALIERVIEELLFKIEHKQTFQDNDGIYFVQFTLDPEDKKAKEFVSVTLED